MATKKKTKPSSKPKVAPKKTVEKVVEAPAVPSEEAIEQLTPEQKEYVWHKSMISLQTKAATTMADTLSDKLAPHLENISVYLYNIVAAQYVPRAELDKVIQQHNQLVTTYNSLREDLEAAQAAYRTLYDEDVKVRQQYNIIYTQYYQNQKGGIPHGAV